MNESRAHATSLATVGLAGAILVSFALFLGLEHLAIGFGYRHLFVAAWEMGLARNFLSPILLAGLTLPALSFAFFLRWLEKAPVGESVRVLSLLGALFGVSLGWGLSYGRHFQARPLRAAFVGALGLVSLFVVRISFTRFIASARTRPRWAAAVAFLVSVAAWMLDARVLPRLYPAFHDALFLIEVTGSALFAFAIFRTDNASKGWRLVPLVAALGGVLLPPGARAMSFATNLRFILTDRAPWLGRAIAMMDLLAKPEEETLLAVTNALPTEVQRKLHWDNENILLITIDALRADHVGAYGYDRPTTPAIDALAKEGVLFERAYCPTPHTSYSVTSMMTGKYMRPLINHGLGDDSELLATSLRRYGFRTAAFYPPAVFFIDADRFRTFSESRLGFEYARIEFGSPELRTSQIATYLASAQDAPRVFLWVHLFEPHEPYVRHPDHVFGERHIDDYDSEIRTADDGVGAIVRAFRQARPNTSIFVTADHGEEFDDHGGKYHGTSVFEEQVHVPLIVVGSGVKKGTRLSTVVQTIDLFPTMTSAVGIPRDPRVLGRDLGSLLAGEVGDSGLAYAETDAAHLVAVGSDRLICSRTSTAACALYDVAKDRAERVDEAMLRSARRQELVAIRKKLFDDLTRYEPKTKLPPALKAALAGDADAENEVVSLLDDANPDVRVEAAFVLFTLSSPALISRFDLGPPFLRARSKEDDVRAREALDLALARRSPTLDATTAARMAELLKLSADPRVRRAAAFVLAEHADVRGVEALVEWLNREGPPKGRIPRVELEALLGALGRSRIKLATLALLESFNLLDGHPEERKLVIDALRETKDGDAVPTLLDAFQRERYVDLREREARALFGLGAGRRMVSALRRFAGMPDGSAAYLEISEALGELRSSGGFASSAVDTDASELSLHLASKRPQRLLIELRDPEELDLVVDGQSVRKERGTFFSIPLGPLREGKVTSRHPIRRIWSVDQEAELPPPAPEPWDGGTNP